MATGVNKRTVFVLTIDLSDLVVGDPKCIYR
jgi:hypothetical protein